MNIYSKKQSWKILLFIAAVVIVILSLWYTNTLVHKIAEDEQKKLRLWADAIHKKASLVRYTNDFFNKIRAEEKKKVELWAKATKQLLASPSLNTGDLGFIFEVIRNNETVPVILTDSEGNIVSHRNLDSARISEKGYLQTELQSMKEQGESIEIDIYKGKKNFLYYKDSRLFSELKEVLNDLIRSFISEVAVNSASVPVIFTDSTQQNVIGFGNIDSAKFKDPQLLKETIAYMASENPPIEIDLGEGGINYIFYQDSFLLTQLRYYPYVQFGVIGLFLLIAYMLFSTARKAEQNQVWVGMAKETAHQLGTPLSSLIAWIELMKTKGADPATLNELQKDVHRLEVITERFSKIGSATKLEREDIIAVMEESIDYMRSRTSRNVSFSLKHANGGTIYAPISKSLFEWVIENIFKNAVDAMDGKGSITVEVSDQVQFIYIDITDTGKGIPKSKYKTVFQPGYTTRRRGWGLGLSLSKRIIENYHAGKIFVKRSEVGKGTTFRIVLNK